MISEVGRESHAVSKIYHGSDVGDQQSLPCILARGMSTLGSMQPDLIAHSALLYPVARKERCEAVLVCHAGQTLERKCL